MILGYKQFHPKFSYKWVSSSEIEFIAMVGGKTVQVKIQNRY